VISGGEITILYQGRRYGLGVAGDRFAICDVTIEDRPAIWQFPCDDPGWQAACQAYASLEKLSGEDASPAPPGPERTPSRRRWALGRGRVK
jgi:hypothetical protein